MEFLNAITPCLGPSYRPHDGFFNDLTKASATEHVLEVRLMPFEANLHINQSSRSIRFFVVYSYSCLISTTTYCAPSSAFSRNQTISRFAQSQLVLNHFPIDSPITSS